MKILLCGDVHWSDTSSIVTSIGNKYTTRLDNLIRTINWVEETAVSQGCREVYYLGDFFDKPVLKDLELTALSEIKWNNLFHYFIVGNHESTKKDLSISTSSALALSDITKEVINTPTVKMVDNCAIIMIPYITEDDRKPLTEYLSSVDSDTKRLVLSHNDIEGIQMGAWKSKEGFKIEEIDNNCDLYINGHLHNGCRVSDKAINIGNITGQNFGEDAFQYAHNVFIFDTDTFTFEVIENPYALNFYKLEVSTVKDLEVIEKLKTNCVLSIKCVDTLVEELKSKLAQIQSKVVASRIIAYREQNLSSEQITSVEDFSIDYLVKFSEFCNEKIGSSPLLDDELNEVCK